MTTQKQRLEALRKAESSVSELYSSIETARLLSSLTKKHGLKDGGGHIDVIGDVILGFYSKKDLSTLLQEQAAIPEEQARALAAELKGFLEPIPEVPAPPVDEKLSQNNSMEHKQVRLAPEVTTDNPRERAVENTQDAKPLTREELNSYLAPQRTMQDDVETIEQKEQQEPRDYAAAQQTGVGAAETSEPKNLQSENGVPQYARPLTDTQPHHAKKNDNPQRE